MNFDMEVWHDPETDKWLLKRGSRKEELGPLAVHYMKDMADGRERLRELVAMMWRTIVGYSVGAMDASQLLDVEVEIWNRMCELEVRP